MHSAPWGPLIDIGDEFAVPEVRGAFPAPLTAIIGEDLNAAGRHRPGKDLGCVQARRRQHLSLDGVPLFIGGEDLEPAGSGAILRSKV